MHCTKCACVKYHETKIVCPLRNVKIRLNFNFHMFSAGAGVFFPEPEFFLPEPEPEVKNPEFAQHYLGNINVLETKFVFHKAKMFPNKLKNILVVHVSSIVFSIIDICKQCFTNLFKRKKNSNYCSSQCMFSTKIFSMQFAYIGWKT